MSEFFEWVGVAVFIVLVVIGVALLEAIPVWLLWNWLVPIISKGVVAEITLWQAFWLNILTALLFKSSHYSTKE